MIMGMPAVGLPKTDRAMRTFDLTAAILLALPVAQAQVPDIAGFSKTWFDDFTGSRGALPSSGNWLIDTGTSYPGGPANWGTGEVQTYTNSPSNVATNGQGNLVITAIKDAKGAWTSARIETKQTFMAPAGKKMRVQASLKLPNLGGGGIGYWPAFWTLGAAYRGNYWNWPSVGEIDIMENVNNVNRVWAVLHCGTNPGGPCNEPSGLGNNKNCPANSPCSGVFRTYTVEVDRTKSPEAIRWYVNDQLLHSVTQTQLPAAVWANTTQKAHFVLLNMAMGGSFPDAIYGSKTPIASTVSGGTLEAQYVAVYYSK
ncbi:glycosyl hydrolase family 16 [Colletotrichum asianum]